MLGRFVWLIVMVPLAIVLIALSVANRNVVPFTFDPFTPGNPMLTISAPLFMYLFASLVVGLVLGAAVTWLAQGRHRSAARRAAAEIASLRKEAQAREAALRAGQPALPAA
ncbi:MAG: lipopolysaccharide assembly protein LapA domain-containing protein [Rhizobiaceae bacterium]